VQRPLGTHRRKESLSAKDGCGFGVSGVCRSNSPESRLQGSALHVRPSAGPSPSSMTQPVAPCGVPTWAGGAAFWTVALLLETGYIYYLLSSRVSCETVSLRLDSAVSLHGTCPRSLSSLPLLRFASFFLQKPSARLPRATPGCRYRPKPLSCRTPFHAPKA